jgi:2-iminobutanoate/2-iminopropanoate deaminase
MAKSFINSSEAPAPIGPYNQAILINNILFVSGQIGLDKSGNMVQSDIKKETHQVMNNLKVILQKAGLGFQDVVKCSIFVKDLNKFNEINEAYGEYFPSDCPARETVEVVRLPKDANIEISCIAVRPQ